MVNNPFPDLQCLRRRKDEYERRFRLVSPARGVLRQMKRPAGDATNNVLGPIAGVPGDGDRPEQTGRSAAEVRFFHLATVFWLIP
jgi:hypothetical protein